jgi:phosphonate transport system ATP-binding protein
VGLRVGVVVFDGAPAALDEEVLTRIYGEEDWTAMRHQAEEDAREDAEAAAFEAAREERMAGMV